MIHALVLATAMIVQLPSDGQLGGGQTFPTGGKPNANGWLSADPPQPPVLHGLQFGPDGYVRNVEGWPTGFYHPSYQWNFYHKSLRIAEQGWKAERFPELRDPYAAFGHSSRGPGSPPWVVVSPPH